MQKSWPSIPTFVPHRLRRKLRSTKSRLRSRQSPTSNIASLEISISPTDTLRSLRHHRWSYYDGQYILLAIIGIFALCIIQEPGPTVKTLIASMLLLSLLLPLTRQFFLPFLPIAGWLFLWYGAKYISGEYRPPIWVRVLPTLENICYGANLSNILSAHKHVVLDVLAWVPYGLTHFGAPFVVSAIMFIFAPPGLVPSFARTFGYMNVAGVAIQLCFPTSPPWYENKYGLAPANYSIPGSPAGLAAIDKLLGVDMYTSSFTASPLVFGAFPSLHAANATLEALFMSYVFPRLMPLFVIYAMWICWATMYLSHHYAIDLVGGSLLAGICFFISKSKFIPRMQAGKEFRWDYDYVEVGDTQHDEYANTFDGYHDFQLQDDDRWTVGSSSASTYSSAGRSPSLSSGGAPRSPMDDGHAWDGDTLASGSDSEHGR